MKKLLFVLFITLFIFSCKRYVDCLDNYHYNSQDATGITLNGVNEDTAKTMMANYLRLKAQDTRPTRESVWFDAKSFHNMVMLLTNEHKIDKLVDGMRVYFVSKPNLVNGHMVTSVVFVKTKDAGEFTPDPTQRLHKDYYDLNKKDPLFDAKRMDSLKGFEEKRPALIANIIQGQNLYNVYFGCNPDTLPGQPHYISRTKARAMANQFGRDTMTTKGEWFDLKMLQQLDATTHDGIRLYFTRHNSFYKYPKHPIKEDKDAFKEAFVLIPTTAIDKGGLRHKDNFDKTNLAKLDKYIQAIYDDLQKSGRARPMMALDSAGGDDNGSLCPFNCNPQ